jgi:nucleoid DNA-binding protein
MATTFLVNGKRFSGYSRGYTPKCKSLGVATHTDRLRRTHTALASSEDITKKRVKEVVDAYLNEVQNDIVAGKCTRVKTIGTLEIRKRQYNGKEKRRVQLKSSPMSALVDGKKESKKGSPRSKQNATKPTKPTKPTTSKTTAPPRAAAFQIAYQGVTVRVVPVKSVFAYTQEKGSWKLVKQASGLHADLYNLVVRSEASLCEVGTGVSCSQSLKPDGDGNGLLYQTGCHLLVAEEGGALKGLGLICLYEEGLIEPRAYGKATRMSLRLRWTRIPTSRGK